MQQFPGFYGLSSQPQAYKLGLTLTLTFSSHDDDDVARACKSFRIFLKKNQTK